MSPKRCYISSNFHFSYFQKARNSSVPTSIVELTEEKNELLCLFENAGQLYFMTSKNTTYLYIKT